MQSQHTKTFRLEIPSLLIYLRLEYFVLIDRLLIKKLLFKSNSFYAVKLTRLLLEPCQISLLI